MTWSPEHWNDVFNISFEISEIIDCHGDFVNSDKIIARNQKINDPIFSEGPPKDSDIFSLVQIFFVLTKQL